ncbi:MAG: hypothetical protein KJ070_25885 [Verrucomicrobia bacterium]|nr:hypothetical protein [Verrucomicrobiota bacterium]
MKARLAVFLLACVECKICAASDADFRWDFRFGRPALEAGAVASAWFRGELHVGGAFVAAGRNFSPGVARWDGTNWCPLGEGLSVTNAGSPAVATLAVYDGELYAGGLFVRSGDVALPGLARWNGTNWNAVPGVATADVRQLLVHESALLVVGNLSFNDDTNRYAVARWNGAAWETFDSRIPSSGVAGCAAANGNEIFISGSFSSLGGNPISYNARWNGALWQPLSGLTNQSFWALAVEAGQLYGSGYFTSIGGTSATNLARWDGTNWWPVGGGFDEPPGRLISTSNGLLAIGGFKQIGNTPVDCVARWDGAQWLPIGLNTWTGNERPIDACLADDGRLFAVGYFFSVQGQRAGHAARWTGTEWLPLVISNSLAITDGFLSVFSLAADAESLFVGGVYSEPFGPAGRAVWQLKSNAWTKLGSDFKSDGSPVLSALAIHGGQLHAGGNFTNAGGATARNLARWDGAQWNPAGGGTDGEVRAMSSDGTNLFIGGNFATAGTTPAAGVARWDGANWHALGSGMIGAVNALTWANGALHAGGTFTNAGGQSANRIAVWKNSQWQPLGGGVDGPTGVTVQAIVVDGTNVYVGGRFTTAGGVPVNNIARWDGAQWHPLGQGSSNGVLASATAVMSLAMQDGMLYVGGFFTNAGSRTIPGLAKFEGSDWRPLGSGLRGWEIGPAPRVRALVGQNNALWIGGIFPGAGNKSAVSLARWVESPQLTLAPPHRLNDGEWLVTLQGVLGLRYQVEISTNLVDWLTFSRGEAVTDPVTTQAMDAAGARFFRASLEP